MSCYADSDRAYLQSCFSAILSARKADRQYLNLFQKQREAFRSVTSMWELSTQIWRIDIGREE